MAGTSDLLSVAEAATLAGVSERTMRRWAASGQVRTVGRSHARRIPVSEVAAIPATNGRSGTDNRTATAAVAEEAGHLAALVRELQAKVADLAGAAGMWQVRAEVLAAQLEQARGELRALQAPQNAQNGTQEGRRAAESPDPTTEPPEAPSEPPEPLAPDPLPTTTDGRQPWWRRWRRWAAIVAV